MICFTPSVLASSVVTRGAAEVRDSVPLRGAAPFINVATDETSWSSLRILPALPGITTGVPEDTLKVASTGAC